MDYDIGNGNWEYECGLVPLAFSGFFFFFFVGLIMVSNGFGGTLNFRS